MTPRLLGVDISSWQPASLPWQAWKDFGVRFVIARSSIGHRADYAYTRHRAQARAAGVPVGLYHCILEHDAEIAYFDPVRAAAVWWRLHEPGDTQPLVLDGVTLPRSWVDVEAPGVNARMLAQFMAEFHRLAPGVLVGIYTSGNYWHTLIGRGRTEFSHYPWWIADYTLDPPRLPDIATRATIFQFRFRRGYLPAYPDDLDLNWVDVGDNSPPPPPPVPEDIVDAETTRRVLAHLGSAREDMMVGQAAFVAARAKLDAAVALMPVVVVPPPPWWTTRPLPFDIPPQNRVIQFYRQNNTPFVPPRSSNVTWVMRVTAKAGDMLLVHDPDGATGTVNDLWIRGQDVVILPLPLQPQG